MTTTLHTTGLVIHVTMFFEVVWLYFEGITFKLGIEVHFFSDEKKVIGCKSFEAESASQNFPCIPKCKKK